MNTNQITLTLNVVVHHTDNGDGSTSAHLFNNREELKADLENGGYSTTLEDIESGDDPYVHGTLTDEVIELEFDPTTNNVRLAQSVSFTSDG